jgi:hypothetical protein
MNHQPADLPVEHLTKFELVVNLTKGAKQLGWRFRLLYWRGRI